VKALFPDPEILRLLLHWSQFYVHHNLLLRCLRHQGVKGLRPVFNNMILPLGVTFTPPRITSPLGTKYILGAKLKASLRASKANYDFICRSVYSNSDFRVERPN
jgi:hypothetical protein